MVVVINMLSPNPRHTWASLLNPWGSPPYAEPAALPRALPQAVTVDCSELCGRHDTCLSTCEILCDLWIGVILMKAIDLLIAKIKESFL